MERKTHKILDINEQGKHLVCIYNAADKVNPYRLYEVFWQFGKYGTTEHRRQIAKYADFKSVLCLVASLY